MRVLILGGTGEARELADLLLADGHEVISSLAGRVKDPRLPAGEVRIGGFGGAHGLTQWLQDSAVTAVVDATHPFAERISASAVLACSAARVPLVYLHRAPWTPQAGDRWTLVPTLEAAAREAARYSRVLLTIGRQKLHVFSGLPEHVYAISRCVDAPEPPLPPQGEVWLTRGPFTFAGEMEAFERLGIDALVTKNSGGSATDAKLEAARELGIPVIMVTRPHIPGAEGTPTAATAAGAQQLLYEVVGSA